MKKTKEEFQQIYQRTRKLMTMHQARHDEDRLYVSIKERAGGFVSTGDSVAASI